MNSGRVPSRFARIKDFLPGRKDSVGVTAISYPLFVEAALYRYRAGIPWRDLPERFGDWKSVHRRFSRWMVEALLLQPAQMSSDPTVLEHECAHLLAVNADGLNRSGASTYEVAYCFVAFIWHPYWCEICCAQKLGKRHCITSVRFHPLAGLPWDERRRCNCARVAERGDEPIQAIPGRAGFVAEMRAQMLAAMRLTTRHMLSADASISPR